MEQATQTQVKVRTLKGYCKAIFDVLNEAKGQPVSALVLDGATTKTSRGATKSTDATGARIRDLRKPQYGGHNIVYSAKDKTYTLVA